MGLGGCFGSLSRACELLAVIVVIVIGPAERLDGRYGCPPIVGVGVKGVIGEEGAFMIRPPQRLQCVFPEGL